MNGIKAQYILAISVLFGVAIYSLYSSDKTDIQESYKEIPKDYLKRDRGIAQVPFVKTSIKASVAFKRLKTNRMNLVVNDNRNSNIVQDKELIKRFSFDKSQNGSPISIVKNFKAILKNDENLNLYPDSPLKGNYIIVSADEVIDGAKTLVVNTTENEVGIFFDIVKVKLKSNDSTELFNYLSSYSYEVIENHSHLNLFEIKFSNSDETVSAYNLLKEKAFAKRVSLEIKYYFRTYR